MFGWLGYSAQNNVSSTKMLVNWSQPFPIWNLPDMHHLCRSWYFTHFLAQPFYENWHPCLPTSWGVEVSDCDFCVLVWKWYIQFLAKHWGEFNPPSPTPRRDGELASLTFLGRWVKISLDTHLPCHKGYWFVKITFLYRSGYVIQFLVRKNWPQPMWVECWQAWLFCIAVGMLYNP